MGELHTHLASEFRSWEGKGDLGVQCQIQERAENIASGLSKEYLSMPKDKRPDAWFTYHLYHKAPDWIGPKVARELNIPYFVAEASLSARQTDGKWARGHVAATSAIRQARRIFNLNPKDYSGLTSAIQAENTLIPLLPFLNEPEPATLPRTQLREQLGLERSIPPSTYWLCSVAMMRRDSKLTSYQILAEAIKRLERKDWHMIIIGGGAAETEVKQAFGENDRIHFLGTQPKTTINAYLHASDLFLWPAVNEAFGMAILEALAAGLPVIAGHQEGVAQIVDHRRTGLLIDPINDKNLAQHIELLLGHPMTISRMANQSRDKFQRLHTLEQAHSTLLKGLKEGMMDHASACLPD